MPWERSFPIGVKKGKCIIIGIRILVDQHTLTMVHFSIGWLFTFMEVYAPHGSMMSWRMMFSVRVSIVCSAWFPVNIKLSLFYSVSNPEESHIHGFGVGLQHLRSLCQITNHYNLIIYYHYLFRRN